MSRLRPCVDRISFLNLIIAGAQLITGRSFETCIDSPLYHTEPGTLPACLVPLFAVVRLLVDFFPAAPAPVVAPRFIAGARLIVGCSFAREDCAALFEPAVARADFFRVAVEPRRAVFVFDAAVLAVGAFLRVTFFVGVPSCRGFSSEERCAATTSL